MNCSAALVVALVGFSASGVRAQDPDSDLLLMHSEVFSATVTAVVSGDTIRVARDREEDVLILRGVDAPEPDQPFFAEAKRFLEKHLLGELVVVEAVPAGGRALLGRVRIESADISRKLVEQGLAWYCPPPGGDDLLAKAERQARLARRGLWSHKAHEPPWQARNAATCSAERS